jgi:hypothetical protein
MAIIYSYPETTQILLTDMLIGTSTIRIAGKKKNLTKNFTIETLGLFIQDNFPTATPNLNQVLTVGNTSLLNAKIGQLYLYDTSELDYGHIALADSGYDLYNALGGLIARIEGVGIVLQGPTYNSQILTGAITANRAYTLPNASGTIALTSDIPPAVTPNLNDVLTVGNTSVLDAKVGTLGLWDTINSYYNKLGTLGNTFYYQLNSGANIFTVSSSSLNLNNGTAALEIINPITATRTLYWPDATGIIALTSDIPAALTFTSPLVDTLGTITIDQSNTTTDGYLSSTDWNIFNGKQDVITLTTTGTSGAATFIANTLNIPNYSTDLSGYVPTSRTLTINGTLYDLTTDRSWSVGTVTSVGLSMPPAFTVSSSPITGTGTIAVTGAGTSSQYIRGDGQLATMPSGGGGGSSVNYYLNGSIAASVATYKQLSNTAIIGGGTDFSLTGNGLITQFLTDVGNPNRIEIPGGAWNFEMWFSMSSSGGTPKFYVELLKYDGITFTTIANSSAVPETITGGTSIDLYLTSLAVPTTTLLSTDRLAIRVYIVGNSGGRTATLHTEDNHLCQIITTFSGGVTSLNGLTANTQYLAVGTTGTDFNISSVSETHTFNLPTASATNRGALSTTDWTAFNGKFTLPALTSGSVLFSNGTTIAQDNSNFFFDDTNNRLGIGTNVPTLPLDVNGQARIVGTLNVGNTGTAGNISLKRTSDGSEVGGIRADGSGSGTQIGGSGYSSNILLNNGTTGTSGISFTTGGERMRLFGATGNLVINSTTDNGGKLQIKAPGALFTDIALRVRNSADTGDLMTVNGLGTLQINTTTNLAVISIFSSGNASRLQFQSGAYNNIQANGAVPFYFDFGENLNFRGSVGGSQIMRLVGSTSNVLIGTTTDNGGKLQVKAPGALSTDIALRVRNSADTGDLLLVRGDNFVTVNKLIPTEIVFNGGAQQIGINGIANLTRYYSSGLVGQKIQSQTGYNLLLSPGTVAGQTVIIESVGGVGVTISNSAILQANSTTQGFLPPRMTNAQRIAIATPAVGLCVYCTDAVEGLYINKSTGWTYIG